MNLSSFKLNRVYLDPIKCQIQATFPGVEFSRILFRFKKRKKIRRRMSTSSIKREIVRFHVVVVRWTSKKCTKKRDGRGELLF